MHYTKRVRTKITHTVSRAQVNPIRGDETVLVAQVRTHTLSRIKHSRAVQVLVRFIKWSLSICTRLLMYLRNAAPKRYRQVFVVVVVVCVGVYASLTLIARTDMWYQYQDEKYLRATIEGLSAFFFDESENEYRVYVVDDPNPLIVESSAFKDARKGDRIIVYANAKKAFLYSTDAHKIISVAELR